MASTAASAVQRRRDMLDHLGAEDTIIGMNTQMLGPTGPVRFIEPFDGGVVGLRYNRVHPSSAPGMTASVPAKSGAPLQVTITWRSAGDGAIDVDIDGRRMFSAMRDSSVIAEPKLRALIEMLVTEMRYRSELGTMNGPYNPDRLKQLGDAVFPAVSAYRQARDSGDAKSVEDRL